METAHREDRWTEAGTGALNAGLSCCEAVVITLIQIQTKLEGSGSAPGSGFKPNMYWVLTILPTPMPTSFVSNPANRQAGKAGESIYTLFYL